MTVFELRQQVNQLAEEVIRKNVQYFGCHSISLRFMATKTFRDWKDI